MGKLNSNFSVQGNFSIETDKPMDDRIVVESYSDLFNTETWDNFQYVGMVVSVIADKVLDNNGVYIFLGPKDRVHDTLSWVKLGYQMKWEEGVD